MAFDPDQPLERAGFKFFKRCDIRDTASFLRNMKTWRARRTTSTHILGLGAIYEQRGFPELEDLPEMVAEIEEGLKHYRTSYRAHRMRRKDWIWDGYDEIWGFDE
eukprot:1123807-Heterocapsa_arctica.AAC.1